MVKVVDDPNAVEAAQIFESGRQLRIFFEFDDRGVAASVDGRLSWRLVGMNRMRLN